MKKFLALLTLLFVFGFSNSANALTYEQAMSQSKPVAILVYASWADDINTIIPAFNTMAQNYGDSYNFVLMDIADKSTKAFNNKYHIYPNLPYFLLFKDGGKISRYLKKDCILDSSCFAERLDFFHR